MLDQATNQEAPKTNVTVAEFDELCKNIAEREKEKEKIEEDLKAKNKEIATLEGRAVAYMKELKRTQYDSPFGKFKIDEKWTVNMPDGDVAKLEFFDWLRRKGIFDKYATVNYQSLQSLFKAEKAIAIAKGEDGVLFAIPGIGAAKVFEKLDFKPVKKKVE